MAGEGSIGIEFSSSSNEGALLVLPEGADKHDLYNLLLFEREALRCGKSWYEFAVTKLGRTRISPDSIYLITGCHKTSSWSLAAFYQSSGSCNFNAQFTAGKIINGNINAAYNWRMTSAVPCRIGPEPYDEVKNQTVFIRGFKIAIRESMFLSLFRRDVIVSYEPPNAAPRKAYSSQHIRMGSGSKNDHRQAGGSTSTSPRASSLNLGVSPEIERLEEADERHQEDEISIDTDISLSQMPPTKKVTQVFDHRYTTSSSYFKQIYHPSDLLIECIMENDV